MKLSIYKYVSNELTIKKSHFICLIFPINNLKDINNNIQKSKRLFQNANHYCFAYSFQNKEKAYDDGEPHGTAGIPILNIIKKNKLNNILIVVIRYFGGIKLGATKLTMTYRKCVLQTIKKSILCKIIYCVDLSFSVTYQQLNKLKNIISESINYNIKYDQKVCIQLTCDLNKLNTVENKINNNLHTKIKFKNNKLYEKRIILK